jgi:hypothetical protein
LSLVDEIQSTRASQNIPDIGDRICCGQSGHNTGESDNLPNLLVCTTIRNVEIVTTIECHRPNVSERS